MMKRWSSTHEWFKRAEAYDHDMMSAEHEARRAARAEAAGTSELEVYREKLKRNADLIGKLAVAMTAKVAQSLQKLPDGANVPSATSSAARAAAVLMTTATDHEAAALGVDDLIGAFSRGNEDPE